VNRVYRAGPGLAPGRLVISIDHADAIWFAVVARRGPLAYNPAMSEELTDGLVRWLHVLSAVIFVGPQVFLAAIAMPALRTIDEARARQAAIRRITLGFGVLGGIALAVLLATGIYQYYQFESLIDNDRFPRYFFLIQLKLTLVTIVIILTVLHGMVLGRRLQRLQEAGAPESEIARARTWSMTASIVNLAVSSIIVLCATRMASDWSKL
jgi:uncharacterized membrane protein